MFTYLDNMRIKLVELRKIIRSVISEAQAAPTISADLDPNEKELAKKFPTWSAPAAKRIGAESPASVKAKQVARILQAKGITADAGAKKKTTHELLPFIQKMDPADAFVMDPDDIASKFAEEVLGVKRD